MKIQSNFNNNNSGLGFKQNSYLNNTALKDAYTRLAAIRAAGLDSNGVMHSVPVLRTRVGAYFLDTKIAIGQAVADKLRVLEACRSKLSPKDAGACEDYLLKESEKIYNDKGTIRVEPPLI